MDVADSMAFLFLDESTYEPLDLAALTGVLVPLESYAEVRDAICQVTWDVLAPPANTVPSPIELHARDLLAELSNRDPRHLDRARLGVLGAIVRIVNEYRLQVFRVAYLNRTEIAATMIGDPKLYGLNFFAIQSALQDKLADTVVLPVMDGVPGCAQNARHPPRIDPQLIRAFARNVRYIHHCRRCSVVARSLSIRNVANLAEPVFADSAHSTLLQLADITSYLLLQVDRAELEAGAGFSEYRSAVLECARGLRSDLLDQWRGRLETVATALGADQRRRTPDQGP